MMPVRVVFCHDDPWCVQEYQRHAAAQSSGFVGNHMQSKLESVRRLANDEAIPFDVRERLVLRLAVVYRLDGVNAMTRIASLMVALNVVLFSLDFVILAFMRRLGLAFGLIGGGVVLYSIFTVSNLLVGVLLSLPLSCHIRSRGLADLVHVADDDRQHVADDLEFLRGRCRDAAFVLQMLTLTLNDRR